MCSYSLYTNEVNRNCFLSVYSLRLQIIVAIDFLFTFGIHLIQKNINFLMENMVGALILH
jgi:hypothetical protein